MLATRVGQLPVTIMFCAGATCFAFGMLLILGWAGLLIAVGVTLLMAATPAITVQEANWKSKHPAAIDPVTWQSKQPIKLS